MEETPAKPGTSRRVLVMAVLIAATGIGAVVALIVFAIIPGQQQHQRVIESLKRRKVNLMFGNNGQVTTVDLTNVEVTPELEQDLGTLHHLVNLDASGTAFSDNGLMHLQACRELFDLKLTNSKVTDAGMKYLGSLSKLDILLLDGTSVGDEGLSSLRGMTNLGMLNLNDTKLTDEGLKSLSGLTNLEFLSVGGTPITDDGLESLKSLQKLSTLDLLGTDVTPQGNKRFSTLVPSCSTLYVSRIRFKNRDDRSKPIDQW